MRSYFRKSKVENPAKKGLSATDLRERMRLIKDRAFAIIMATGGIAVIAAITSIFLYLFYVVAPLFSGADASEKNSIQMSQTASLAGVGLDEYSEIVFSMQADGTYRFLSVADGTELLKGRLSEESPSTVAFGDPASRMIFAALENGRVLVARSEYEISYPDDERHITPSLSYPYGKTGFEIFSPGNKVEDIAGQANEETATVAVVTHESQVTVVRITSETSFLGGQKEYDVEIGEIDLSVGGVEHILINSEQREFYAITESGEILLYDVSDLESINLIDRVVGSEGGAKITSLQPLSGGISVILGDSFGGLSQWFPVRDSENRYSLAEVRRFPPMPSSIVDIAPEHYRKAFAAMDADGNIAFNHTTAGHRNLFLDGGSHERISLAIAPRANAAVIVAENKYEILHIENKHPEVSFEALWGEIWYESRQEPEYIWQSSSASSDFEPKFSLMPLTFGTIKATFYSMLFAVPLAVFGAVYTAYFMTPRMRAIVKPSIEVMAALPTVILGFLAGLWLAPLLEKEIIGFALSVVVLPATVLLTSRVWVQCPQRMRQLIPEGWEAMLLIPVTCFAIWLSFICGTSIELSFFEGSFPHWLSTEYGIGYDQRNSIVVGLAIGFAVIPTIFSISEDAVFGVPRSLTMGSLALGATPWQTALRIVLLTASPGIFSAIMIGMGRAVGETMIVLMATGNTPIMDMNMFQGFRALSANIAVEMPESEVGSSHYRILFLAALVLFLVTFLVNTLAEIVRQRLRTKYASL